MLVILYLYFAVFSSGSWVNVSSFAFNQTIFLSPLIYFSQLPLPIQQIVLKLPPKYFIYLSIMSILCSSALALRLTEF